MKEVSQIEFLEFLDNRSLDLHSTLSDVEGVSWFGKGYPCMETKYGLNGETLAISESTKEFIEDPWDQKYYIKERQS